MRSTSIRPGGRYPLVLAFFFSLLQANWTYTGYDASAHVAEETVGARMSSAWGVFLSVAVSAIVGFVFLLALTTHLPNLTTLFPATLDDAAPGDLEPVLLRWRRRRDLRSSSTTSTHRHRRLRDGDLLAAGIAIAMAFCGLSSVASAGRMLFAFSRDDGIPGSRLAEEGLAPLPDPGQLADRDGRRRLAVLGRRRCRRRRGAAIVIVTAISTIFLYAAYGVVHLPRARPPRMAQGASLEPRPLVQADRLAGDRSGSSS